MMWGEDPVHPKRGAYTTKAARVLDEIGSAPVRHPKRPSDPGTAPGPDYGRGQRGWAAGANRNRESWAGGSQTVATRCDDPRPPSLPREQNTVDSAAQGDTSTRHFCKKKI